MFIATPRGGRKLPLFLTALCTPMLMVAGGASADAFVTLGGEATVESNARFGSDAPFDADALGAVLPVDASFNDAGAFGDRITASVNARVPGGPGDLGYGGRSSVGGVLMIEDADTISTSLFTETFWQTISGDELGRDESLQVRGSAEYRGLLTLDTDISAVINATVTGTNSSLSLFSGTNETITANRLFSLASPADAAVLESVSDSVEVDLAAGTYLLLMQTFSPADTMGVATGRSAVDFVLLASRAAGLGGGVGGGVSVGGGDGGEFSPVPSPTAAAGGLALLGLSLLRRRPAA